MLISQQRLKKAVAYYRHSAEDKQENSTTIQREHTEKFAHEHAIEIIHEEVDEGKSGLLPNRPGFERLFANWIENPDAPHFDYVLVYDVSRWGRFQDQDQAAHLVFLCKKNGKEVVYVSRGFLDTTNQLISSLETSIQRYMAAEYSRQLSDKVFHGCVKVSEQGYSAGGIAAYGMARQLLDVRKEPIRLLKSGEHKQIANERVTFTPKNDETTEVVREIFYLFVKERRSIPGIATEINRKGTLTAHQRLWDKSKIINILTNETYIGTRIYNKTWGRLKQKSHKNPRSKWVITRNAFPATIDENIFFEAQERLYWMFPSNWRKGINTIKKVKKNIRNDILKWLSEKGLPDLEAAGLINELPMIFSNQLEDGQISHCCFIIPESMRQYENVLAISVNMDSKTMIENFFLLPTQYFTRTNFLILSNDNKLYHNSKITVDKLEETIKFLIRQLKKFRRRYRNKYQFADR